MNRTSSQDFQNSRVVVRKDLTQTIALTDGRKERTPVSAQPKSRPSGVIDIDFTSQFRAQRSDHSLRLDSFPIRLAQSIVARAACAPVARSIATTAKCSGAGRRLLVRGRFYLSIQSPRRTARLRRPFYFEGGWGEEKTPSRMGTGPFTH